MTVTRGTAAHGRASGRARSGDGILGLRLPAELGGDGRGTPEQPFAAGFAACLHGARSLIARQAALDPTVMSVEATVAFGRNPQDGGYVLHIGLVVRWPGVTPDVATQLLQRADALCPYARMAWHGTPTTITPASWAPARREPSQIAGLPGRTG